MLPLKDNGANPIVDSLAVVGEWNIVAKWVVDESVLIGQVDESFSGWEFLVGESGFYWPSGGRLKPSEKVFHPSEGFTHTPDSVLGF